MDHVSPTLFSVIVGLTQSLLYLLSFLDRVNIGVAKLSGLVTDLNLSSLQYSNASMSESGPLNGDRSRLRFSLLCQLRGV